MNLDQKFANNSKTSKDSIISVQSTKTTSKNMYFKTSISHFSPQPPIYKSAFNQKIFFLSKSTAQPMLLKSWSITIDFKHHNKNLPLVE